MASRTDSVALFLCGDVMTGRGIDQILPQSVDPQLFEPVVHDARRYVQLAERHSGTIAAPVSFDYVWRDALAELARIQPDVRVINLETSITTSDDAAFKGIHYRMHPANTPVLTAAQVDCCVLANNHVLDWGRPGLTETLASLRNAGLRYAGAGRDLAQAERPAVFPLEGGQRRLLVFALGTRDSGIPADWAASPRQAGVHWLPCASGDTAYEVNALIRRFRRPDDIVLVSVHWGGNWGYEVPEAHRQFAHALIDGGVHVVHGHSSHHAKAIEVYAASPVLYGCGDFLNDYEGIPGYEAYRQDLPLMYFVVLDDRGKLAELHMTPLRLRRFRLERACEEDAVWIAERLDRECRRFGGTVSLARDLRMTLHWQGLRSAKPARGGS